MDYAQLTYDQITDRVRTAVEALGGNALNVEDTATRLVVMILRDITSRSRLDGAWDAIDIETQREVVYTLLNLADRVLETSAYREADEVAARHDAAVAGAPGVWAKLSELTGMTPDELKKAASLDEDPNLRPLTRAEMNALEDEVQYLHRAFLTERMLIVDMMKGRVSEDDFPITGTTMPHSLALMCRVLVLLINSVPTAKNFVSFGFTDQTTGEVFSLRITRGDDRNVERLAQGWAVRVVELDEDVAVKDARIAELEAELAALRAERS